MHMFHDAAYFAGRQPLMKELSEEESDFTKLFPNLPSFDERQDRNAVVQRLRQLGMKGGLMDAKDPRVTVTNPLASSPTNQDNPNAGPGKEMTVGFTFLGQFLDHDMTLDPSPLPQQWDDESIAASISKRNLRSPFFDLDSVYGRESRGTLPPEDPVSRILYDRSFERFTPSAPVINFLIDAEAPRDLPRTSQLRAIIADPRNDENLIIGQLHLAFLKFHNRVTAYLRESGTPFSDADELFVEVRRLVRWHYQYIIVNQYLKASLDPNVYSDVRDNGPTIFQVSPNAKIPREFQAAAFRFGHSQVRPGYRPNTGFGAPIFDASIDPSETDPNDLRGGTRAARRFVEWDIFFDFNPTETDPDKNRVKANKKIDTILASPLFDLPTAAALPGPRDPTRTLAARNLLRHVQFGLPSGQAIARTLGYAPLSATDLADLQPFGFDQSTPLWFYILREAEVQQGAQRLGQVGSRLVAEVFFGLLLSDRSSYWYQNRAWVPELPRRDGSTQGDFNMVDLLTFAGVA